MTGKKTVRSLAWFTPDPGPGVLRKLEKRADLLIGKGYEIQTIRIVTEGHAIRDLEGKLQGKDLLIGAGTLSRRQAFEQRGDFLRSDNIYFNLEISDRVNREDVDLLFYLVRNDARKTFLFSYTFNNAPLTPYFPAASGNREGFCLGLQPTDLAEGCDSLHTWLFRMKEVWQEILDLFREDREFFGIDSSVAPMYTGDSSLIHLVKRYHGTFAASVTTDTYTSISRFIKEENPIPTGLCGIMFPCLEDFELAEEYESGEFSIERNIFLSLHSGLGIDTYPFGTDEDPERIRQILNLLLALSQKYNKPLSARFISDGKATIGRRTAFRNQYLKDVVIRVL